MILPSGTVPFVLRQVEENVKIHLSVGEAYVHTLMWAEMAEDPRDPKSLGEFVLEWSLPISFPWAWEHNTIDIRGKWILEAFSSTPSLFRNTISYQAISSP